MTEPNAAASVACTKDCTVDCGWCKGDPIGALHRRIRRSVMWSRDAHGGVPFDQKAVWRQGYDEAVRAVMRELDWPRGAQRAGSSQAGEQRG